MSKTLLAVSEVFSHSQCHTLIKLLDNETDLNLVNSDIQILAQMSTVLLHQSRNETFKCEIHAKGKPTSLKAFPRLLHMINKTIGTKRVIGSFLMNKNVPS